MELENPTSGSHTFLLYLEMTNNQSLKSTDDIMICYLKDKDKTTSKHVLNIIGSRSISEFWLTADIMLMSDVCILKVTVKY